MDTTTRAALQAALVALTAALEDDAPAKAPTRKAAKQPKAVAKAPKATKAQPASLVAAKTHCHDARMARRSSTKLGGLTKAERSELYRAHPELSAMSATARKAAWAKLVAAHKAAN